MRADPAISCPEIMAGGTMVVIVAMKMQNILKAERDGGEGGQRQGGGPGGGE